MKMNFIKTSLVAGSAITAAIFVLPSASLSYSTIGGKLGVSKSSNGFQRDVRIFNNAADSSANNNTTPEASWPGALGAPLAIWKGGAAWNSDDIDAGKNFDMNWQGEATGIGTNNNNIVSWLSGGSCGGGVLAYTETPISNGWRIRFCESWAWSDGPGTGGSAVDIEGIMTHEYGHALGLGHTGSGCSGSCSTASTMCAFACGNGSSARSIEPDDANGLAAIYGSIGSGKPTITSISGSTSIGGTLVINGAGFDSTVDVKFNAETGQNTGTIPGTVYGVSSSGGGTQVSVTIPTGVKSGAVHIWEGGARLSNGFPIDIGGSTGCATSNYGIGELGSSGQLAHTSASGTPSVTNPNFSIDLSGGTLNASTVMFSGESQGNNQQNWGTILVAGPGFLRTWTTTNSSGFASISVPVTPAMVGTTKYYQYAVRDPGFGGGVQAADGLMVTFCP